MGVSIKKTDEGYRVEIGNKHVTLPVEAKFTEKPNDYGKFGTSKTYLKVDAHSYGIVFVKDGKKTVIVSDENDDDYDEREQTAADLYSEWRTRPKGGTRRRRHRSSTRKTKHRGRK